MTTAKKEAATPAKTTAPTKNIKLSQVYQNLSPEAREKAINRIAKRRADMPKIYRGTYDKAMAGNSLRAAINAQCLECVQWQRVEVRLCPSTPCPLWPYRPYKPNETGKAIPCSNQPPDGPDFGAESKKSED